jgi:hypothetical protein
MGSEQGDMMLTGQWLTFAVYAALAVLGVVVARRYPHTRSMAFGWLALAVNTTALYLVAFLIWPERVSEAATIVWSFAVRLQVAFTGGWQLIAWARGKL